MRRTREQLTLGQQVITEDRYELLAGNRFRNRANWLPDKIDLGEADVTT